jgi:Holliday junction resolvasome RuvABC ATP-dependent DNA helicase subunit
LEYNQQEKEIIIKRYLDKYGISTTPDILKKMTEKVDAVPREIHNFCIKIRDFVITTSKNHTLTPEIWEEFLKHSKIQQ